MQDRRVHWDYDELAPSLHDLMVVKIAPRIDHIVPIAMNLNPEIPCENEPLIVLGYGLDSANSTTLGYAGLEQVPLDRCSAIYRNELQEEGTMCLWRNGTSATLRPVECLGESGELDLTREMFAK